MKKICFIVQRYGLEVNGGAELYCRQMAEKLTQFYDVTVLTTKAVDYISWRNEYENDEEVIQGVKIRRFEVEQERNIDEFNVINQKVLNGTIIMEEEQEWIDKQGPYVPHLIEFLHDNKNQYHVFIFITYLYYTTVMGIQQVANKSIVIPTAHDEPFLKMKIYKGVFCFPKAIFYNTYEEKKLVEERFGNSCIKNEIGGIGIDVPATIEPYRFKAKYGLDNYIVYVGRIDTGKNCEELFEYFKRFKTHDLSSTKLVLMGKNVIPIPSNEDIISVGFVSDEDKFDGIAGAKFLILPSKFESLSMVVLEAFKLGIPVLVNGKCEVLKGHCIRSNGGLYYKSYPEFEEAMLYLLSHEEVRQQMGKNGKKYVDQNYCWDIIINKLRKLIEYVVYYA